MYVMSITGLLFCLSSCTLPFVGLQYFDGDNYLKNSPCLLMNFFSKYFPGWEYSFCLFGSVNTVSVFSVVGFYMKMHYHIYESQMKLWKENPCKKDLRMRHLKRMIVIGVCNIVGRLPVTIVILLPVVGLQNDNPDKSVWLALLIMPLNAFVNPWIYTLSRK